MFVLALALVLLFAPFALSATPNAAGPRAEGCAFAYNNRFHILGGNKSDVSLFMYTSFPLNVTTQNETVQWSTLSINDLFANMWSTGKTSTTQNSYLRPCVVTPNGTLLVGSNDYYAYDIYHDRWLGRLNMTGAPNPPPLISCPQSITCSQRIVTVDDSLWIFQDVITQSQSPPTNIYILNLTTYSWSTRQAGATILPPNMLRPSLAYVSATQLVNVTNVTTSGVIFLIGGDASQSQQIAATATNTIWMFDIATSLWHLAVSNLTLPLVDCQTFFYPPLNRLYVFPGATNNTSVGMVNTLQLLDLNHSSSSPLEIGISVTNQTKQTGLWPPPIWDQNYVQQGNSIVMYGGWLGGNSTVNSDQFHVYDMAQSQWVSTATTTSFTTPTISFMASTTSSSAGPTGQNNIGPIVGGVIGTVVVCALIVFAAIFVLRKHRRHLRKHGHEQHTSDHYRYTPPHSFGADGTRKPDERQSTIPVTILLSELGDVNHEKPAEIELDGENEKGEETVRE